MFAAGIVAFFAFDLEQYFSLEFIKSQQAELDRWYRANPALTIAVYFAIYVAVTGLSLPGATVMTLVGGALFGVVVGTIVVSFASSVGATISFLASRFLFRDLVRRRFGDRLKAIDAGVAKDGAFYLFVLRLLPPIPFFAINLAMGLVPIRTWTFYWVSQVGMLAGTIVYVNAGTQIARIENVKGLLSPGLILAFAALGVLPFVARRCMTPCKRTRSMRTGRSPPASTAIWSSSVRDQPDSSPPISLRR